IDVADGHAEAEPDSTGVDAGLLANIDKPAVIISEKFITTKRVGNVALILAKIVSSHRPDGVIQQVAVEVAVLVEIEKGGMHRESFVIKPVLRRAFSESEVAVIDQQFIVAEGSAGWP